MKTITPNLWFDGNAKQAVEHYVSVFPDSKITATSYYQTEGLLAVQKALAGKELKINFELSSNAFANMMQMKKLIIKDF
jgi:predicted 3-demethylubiquinone-9 3-methyltransferase (glyoxalase superfamily)